MYIRQTETKTSSTSEKYTTFRIVDGVREGNKVKQRIILNLGKHFDLPQSLWRQLCSRIDERLNGIQKLPGLDKGQQHTDVEKFAQIFASRIIAKRSIKLSEPAEKNTQYSIIDINSLEMTDNRTVGVEHVGMYAINKLQLGKIFSDIGFTTGMIHQAAAAIIGRMAAPGSKAATWEWLTKRSALGELLDVNFSASSVMSLFRISDKLIKSQLKIEHNLYMNIASLFGIQQTVALYDLTNTFFEGSATENIKAARGFSKEKRSDCPLVTLALVLDGQGFIQKSKMFPGNVAEGNTLQGILKKLNASPQAMIIMDRGIATKDNLKYLTNNNFRYLVVSRSRLREFDFTQAQIIQTAGGDDIQVYKSVNDENTEAYLNCYSPKRKDKEQGIIERFMKKYELGLQSISNSLSKPRSNKSKDKILQRIGRLQEKSRGIHQHYKIVINDNAALKMQDQPLLATSITWEKKLIERSMATHPGVYIIRTNDITMSAEKMWKTYIMLTDVEAVFRSLKSELGLRPVFHRKSLRTRGHLFISVLAYQCVQVIRRELRSQGLISSWTTLRTRLSQHNRVTCSFRQAAGTTLHIRKAVQAPSEVLSIYRGLGITNRPGGIKKYGATA
jgi:hypothetical protein